MLNSSRLPAAILNSDHPLPGDSLATYTTAELTTAGAGLDSLIQVTARLQNGLVWMEFP